jgi:hypothetical protein
MESTHTPQRALIKLLAIVGFFALIALIIWAIVQGIRAFPSGFSSLASIAETINGYRPNAELTVTVEKDIVNSGETFTITWNDMGEGEYQFGYECTEGVQFSVRTDQGNLQKINCTEDLVLPGNVTGLFASVESSAQRFSDVAFSVAFDPKNGDVHVKEGRVTVVNATLAQTPTDTTPEAPVIEPVVVVEPKPEPVTPTPTVTPTAPTPKPVTPTETTFTYYPTSIPNGNVDLQITYLGVGTIERGSFVPKATFDEDDRAAFRFEVKNVGTKTADSWVYELTLPGDVDYKSGSQAALLPNERAIYTVGFELIESNDRSVHVEAEVDARGDVNSRNDSFDWSVKVSN